MALVDGVLTDAGERTYYGGRPGILDRAAFQAACPNDSELTVVLGCYREDTIFILRVDRPELSRVMEVTAAHEMLHAAYASLGDQERRTVDGWIDEFYAGMDDPDIREVAARYERDDPQRRHNELHSILATEVGVLSPALERYYGRYFTDRGRVVEANESYEVVFRDRKRRVAELRAQIVQLGAQLSSFDAAITKKSTELESVNRQLDSLDAQGNVRGYNALVPRQNALVDENNGLVDSYNESVNLHNAKVDEVNGLALEQQDLATDLGSRPSIPRGGRR